MSLADHIFIDMCNDILTNGTKARRARKCVPIGRTAPLPTLLRNSE